MTNNTRQSASILNGYALESRFAADNGICARTAARYRNMKNGLPHIIFGGKVYIPIEKAKEWLLQSRLRTRNSPRAA